MSSDASTLSSDKLADLWAQRGVLLWGRVKAVLVLQGVVLAGWYYSMTDDLPEFAGPLALLAAFLTIALLALAVADLVASRRIARQSPALGVLLPGWWTGGLVVSAIFGLFLACDLVMGGVSWRHPHCMAAPAPDDGYEQGVAHRYTVR
jgi:hypothetical protein